jgi:hypothetical protein
MCSRADWARRGMVRVASGEGLQGGPVHVLGTLLHEAAYGLAHAHKVSGTSRQGRSQTAARHPRPRARPGRRPPPADRLVGHQRPHPTAARYAELLAELARGVGAVAPGRAGRPGRIGPIS